jgi:hypothetical protein
MPRPILHERQIRAILKSQRNKARPHAMRRHRDPNGLCMLLVRKCRLPPPFYQKNDLY